LFVRSSIRPFQGWTDFGYFVDGEGVPTSAAELEKMVQRDEAYRFEAFVNYGGSVNVRLRSENREVSAEVKEDIGFRHRGLETTLYQATGSPRLPSTYEGVEDSNESLAAFAEYTLRHGEGDGLKLESVDWDSILENGSGL